MKRRCVIEEDEISGRLADARVDSTFGEIFANLAIQGDGKTVHDIANVQQFFLGYSGLYRNGELPSGETFEDLKVRDPRLYGKSIRKVQDALRYGYKI